METGTTSFQFNGDQSVEQSSIEPKPVATDYDFNSIVVKAIRTFQGRKGFTAKEVKEFVSRKHGLNIEGNSIRPILASSLKSGLLIKNAEGKYRVAAKRRKRSAAGGKKKKSGSRRKKSAKKSKGRKRSSKKSGGRKKGSGGKKRRSKKRSSSPVE